VSDLRPDPAPPVGPLTPAAVASAAAYAGSWLAFRRHLLRVPGVQAALWHEDGLALSTASGVADLADGTPLRTDHLFRIASHSKTFTATAILQLREAGRLRLDDALGGWLSFLAGLDSPLADRTLADLLGHGGGVVRDGYDADFWQLARPFPDEAELRALCGPGSAVLPVQERFKYSNVAYSLLGLVVAAAAGEPYNDYVAREIVQRLGLTRTGPELDPARAGEYAAGYTALSYADERLPIEHVDTRAMSAATGFYGTAEDVCRYASAHFLGDERLLSDDAKRRMQRDQWAVEGTDGAYGLGLAVQPVGDRRMLGHGGGYPGHITRTLFDPVGRLAVSVFTNAIDGPAAELATGLVRLVDLAAAQDAPDGAAETRARFCGRYASLWGVLDVADLGGRLFGLDPTVAEPTERATELRVEDDRTLRIVSTPGYGAPGESLVFAFGVDGGVLSLQGNGGQTYRPLEEYAASLSGLERVALPGAD